MVFVVTACGEQNTQYQPPLQIEVPGYAPFPYLQVGDSYTGTISQVPHIQFDCGALASTYANEPGGTRDGRCVIETRNGRTAATIMDPPKDVSASLFRQCYPINVVADEGAVADSELKRIALAIEDALLAP